MYSPSAQPLRRRWEYISANPTSTNWLVGNSQMARFTGAEDYQIAYKRGGKVMEIFREAERLIEEQEATHIVIDGIQNSIHDIIRGRLDMEMDLLATLKSLNTRAVVVLAEVLFCPEHRRYNVKLLSINRQVRRMNRAASGLANQSHGEHSEKSRQPKIDVRKTQYWSSLTPTQEMATTSQVQK